jgi:hypothetical protein
MKPFIIVGHPNDLHAHYVGWALETAGYQAEFINSSHGNCATGMTLSIDKTNDDLPGPDWGDAHAVWCRRLGPPPVFDEGGGDADEYTVSEERRFTKWFIQLLERSPVRWINQPTAAQAAENKFVQLKLARSCGINIPRTLVTARPDRFKDFLTTEGVIVAKPLDGHFWKNERGETLSAFASVLDFERGFQLSDEDIAQCVTMYQQRIAKVADVRMVVMGADMFAYKVIQDGEQHFDFRIGFYQENHLRYEDIPVPAALEAKMINFMGSLGINFASADFALTADGEFIFLDLNPNGQWLFIEAACPESRLGQKFCSFFTQSRIDPGTERLFRSFSEYRQSAPGKSFEEKFRRSVGRDRSTTTREEARVD